MVHIAFGLILSLVFVQPLASAETYDLAINNGRVIDPDTGLDAMRHVGVSDGVIRAVSRRPLKAGAIIDAAGLVVAPGFIDLNVASRNWHANRVRLMDGVTSVIVMESATSDVNQWYEDHVNDAVINYGTAVGYWASRLEIVGDKSLEGEAKWRQMEHGKATPQQIEAIVEQLDRGLKAGAVGIGIPLEYVPAATHIEMLEVFRLAALRNAPAHVHMRSWGYDEERVRSYGDLYEVLGAAIVTNADIHVLHINSSYNEWTPIGLEMLEKAQGRGLSVSADMYPYAYGACPSGAAYFDDWESYPDSYFSTKLRLASTGEWLTKEQFRAIREAPNEVGLLCYDNTEEMVRLALRSPLTMIASDGGGAMHPRLAGTYSRILGYYVRDEKVLNMNEALRKMTIMPAQHMESRVPAMGRKGRLQPGSDADIVIFDPTAIIDRSTVDEPLRPSEGMRYVIVNGVVVVKDGEIQQDIHAGQPLRAPVSE